MLLAFGLLLRSKGKHRMRRMFLQLIPLCVSIFALPAHGATITAGVYALTGVTVAGYSLTGDVTLDTNGLITAANLTFNDPAVGNPVFTTVASTGSGGYNPAANYAYISGASGQVVLDYLQTAAASGGISLCALNVSCNSYQASYLQIYTPYGFNGSGSAYLSGGTLNLAAGPAATAATPEPSSLILLGIGILAAALVAKRKTGEASRPTGPLAELHPAQRPGV